MIPETWPSRLGAFIRSVIPADPMQLFFLAGIVCFVFAPRMSWLPPQLDTYMSRMGVQDQRVRLDSLPFLVLSTWAMIFSALAGYFVCFRPGLRPLRRVLFFVLLPAVAAICITFGRFAYVGGPYYSVLDKNPLRDLMRSEQWWWWISTPGFHMAFAGLLLVGIFTSRMIFGIASLPLTLPQVSTSESSDVRFWQRVQFLIWVLVGPLFLSGSVAGGVVAAIAFGFNSYSINFFKDSLFVMLSSIVESMTYLGIVYWIVGKAGREMIWRPIRLSKAKYLLLALSLSIGIAVLISTGHYLLDRSIWAASQIGNNPPPELGSYFDLPRPWLLLLFFGAFFEEVVFRGLLQTIFIGRYGLYRGIFLTGTVWAAYHFNSDAFSHPTEQGVLSQLVFRLIFCLSLGFVLSWLTIRSRSIFPATLAHTIYNVLVSSFGPAFPGKAFVWVGLWAVVAYILFRNWPVQGGDEPEMEIPAAEPGIAG